MSQLLKRSFRSFWTTQSTNKNIPKMITNKYCSSYTKDVAKTHSRPEPDILMKTIKSSLTVSELLSAVQRHLPVMSSKHLLQVLRTLFEMQKDLRTTTNVEKITKNPTFTLLCEGLKKRARTLEVNDTIEAVKVLSYLQVPIEAHIFQTLLQLVRYNINDINIRQIMFVDFVLTRYDSKNHLVDALKLALPLVFQIHLPIELDPEDLPLLKDMLAYACHHNLPDRCINNIVTGLLLHNDILDEQVAKSVVWSLTEVNCTAEVYPTRLQLLNACYDVLVISIYKLSYDDVLRTAGKIKRRILERHIDFYHEGLMDSIAEYVVSNEVDFEHGLLIARVLSRIAHTNLTLIEYLFQLAVQDPNVISKARTNILFSFINCMSNGNYIPDPELWNDIKKQIALNPVLDVKNVGLPWTKLCLELASLDFYDERLIAKVFAEDFLNEYLNREESTLDHLQLMTLNESVKTFFSECPHRLPQNVEMTARSLYPAHNIDYQMKEFLTQGLGGEDLFATNVQLPNGIIVDTLICFRDGKPLPLACDSEGKIQLEQLNLPKDVSMLCILKFSQGCYSLNGNRLRGMFELLTRVLDRQGFPTLALRQAAWQRVPERERQAYLMRELRFKAEQSGLKWDDT